MFHLAFGMAALIKTLNHENLGKKRITNTKNFVHETMSVRPLHKHGIVQN
jgi:hypothetical protein